MLYTIDSETQGQSLNSTFEMFRAFIECPRKPQLELAQTKSDKTAFEYSYQDRLANYRRSAIEHYLSVNDLGTGAKTPSYCQPLRMIEDLGGGSVVIEIAAAAIGKKRRTSADMIPMIFLPTRKITKNAKLLLAYIALLVYKLSGTTPSFGKIVRGQSFQETKVQLARLDSEVRELVGVLNRYTVESSVPRRCQARPENRLQPGKPGWSASLYRKQ
jgi:hypothetical protein